MERKPWTDDQNNLVVTEYFRMLNEQMLDRPIIETKTKFLERVGRKLNRSGSAVSAKFQNISAILQELGETWLTGYAPWCNYQHLLVDAVERWLDANDILSANYPEDPALLELITPPTMRNSPPPPISDNLLKLVRKYDIAIRNEQNKELGLAGERYVLAYELYMLRQSQYAELANDVKWISQTIGDGAGYDISSYCYRTGKRRLLEVKTTNGSDRTPFYISDNELTVSREHSDTWILFRLCNFSRKPAAFKLRPPMEVHVDLCPTVYRARFDRHLLS